MTRNENPVRTGGAGIVSAEGYLQEGSWSHVAFHGKGNVK